MSGPCGHVEPLDTGGGAQVGATSTTPGAASTPPLTQEDLAAIVDAYYANLDDTIGQIHLVVAPTGATPGSTAGAYAHEPVSAGALLASTSPAPSASPGSLAPVAPVLGVGPDAVHLVAPTPIAEVSVVVTAPTIPAAPVPAPAPLPAPVEGPVHVAVPMPTAPATPPVAPVTATLAEIAAQLAPVPAPAVQDPIAASPR